MRLKLTHKEAEKRGDVPSGWSASIYGTITTAPNIPSGLSVLGDAAAYRGPRIDFTKTSQPSCPPTTGPLATHIMATTSQPAGTLSVPITTSQVVSTEDAPATPLKLGNHVVEALALMPKTTAATKGPKAPQPTIVAGAATSAMPFNQRSAIPALLILTPGYQQVPSAGQRYLEELSRVNQLAWETIVGLYFLQTERPPSARWT